MLNLLWNRKIQIGSGGFYQKLQNVKLWTIEYAA